jgi:acetylornithine deacetylase/succinyl-diaminopimelate desuccinylase-like protein
LHGRIGAVESLEVLSTLIRHACVNDGSGDACEEPNADVLRSLVEVPGVDVLVVDAAPGRRSVVARWPGTDSRAPDLMLLGHTDVVPADATQWLHDPFCGEVKDGWIWGRGSLDMLGHMSTMALAFRDLALARQHLAGDVVFVAVADEEALGTLGMEHLVRTYPDAIHADWVLGESGGARIGEPPALGVLTSEKGAWRVEVCVVTEPGHSSLPHNLHSAVEIAAEVVSCLAHVEGPMTLTEEYRETARLSFLPHIVEAASDPERLPTLIERLPLPMARLIHGLTRTTITPTGISTPGSWNTLGSQAVVTLDIRSVPGATWEQIHELIIHSLGDLADSVRITLISHGVATSTPMGGELWDVVETASRSLVPNSRLVPAMATGITDARFMRERGASAFGVGLYSDKISPLDMAAMLHGHNERVDVESIALLQSFWETIFSVYASRW